jgi:hypothetical protein
MTDLLIPEAGLALDRALAERSTIAATSRSTGLTTVTAASLLAAVGVVHLVMTPSHIGEWVAEGLAFALLGWVQLGLAAALAMRPSRRVLGSTLLINAAAVALWVVSRTSGFPVGPHANQREAVTLVDGATAAAEAVVIVLALVLAVRPLMTGRLAVRRSAYVVPLAVLGLTTALLASPGARNHAHGITTSANGVVAADGHVHDTAPAVANGAAAEATTATTVHEHGGAAAAPVDDKGFSQLMNGHQHEVPVVPMDGPTTAALAHQLARTAELVASYPTVADAEAAGYRRQGPFSPGLGTHYGKGAGTLTGPVIDDENVLKPMLIYDGSVPESKLVGFMYIAFSSKGVPEGFAGSNDTWHFHTNVCIVGKPDGSVDTPFGADRGNISPELCKSVSGNLLATTPYMVHVWSVPGYENPLGVFHELHSGLSCADGTFYTKPVAEWGNTLTACRNG